MRYAVGRHDIDSFELHNSRLGTRVVVHFSDGARGSYGIDQIPSEVLSACIHHAIEDDLMDATLEAAIIGRFIRATVREVAA